jgi:hypothetical protein
MNWRTTYTYPRAELIEYLREMRRNTFPNNWMHKRDILLQASERNLIQMPQNINAGNSHMVNFSDIVVVENSINTDAEKTTH